jgi:hypothetical protein
MRLPLQRCLVELKLLNAAGAGAIDWAQIFINSVAAVSLGAATAKEALGTALRLEAAAMLEQYAAQLRQLAIAELCLRLRCAQGPDRVQAWRIVVSLPSGAQPCSGMLMLSMKYQHITQWHFAQPAVLIVCL